MSNSPLPPPLNVIFLSDSQLQTKEEMIDEFMDIAKTCKTNTDFYELLSMLFDDVTSRTGELIIERQIRKNAEILDNLRSKE